MSSEATNRVNHKPEASDDTSSDFGFVDTHPVYASDVRIAADPGGVQLIFTRFRSRAANVSEPGESIDADLDLSEVIARIVLPPLAAERLLRLLPDRLVAQQELAREYARLTERHGAAKNATGESKAVVEDPLLEALLAVELDDEPYTDEERAAARAGWAAYVRGESTAWEEVRRSLLDENDTPLIPSL